MAQKNTKAIEILKKVIGVVIVPLLCFVIMEIVCAAKGTTLFNNGDSTFKIFVRGTAIVTLLSLGVSINMHTGRFDFSTGATMVIGGVVGAKVAVATNAGPFAMIVISLLIGCLCGAITGLVYVLTKLPPMVVGLSMTLILEGLTAIITDGCKNVNFGTSTDYSLFSSNPWTGIVIIALALIIMIVIFNYTKIGYDYSALQTGQKIAVNTGIKEKTNAVVCYAIAGALFGVVGALDIMSTNGVTPAYNFTTIAKMFTCFLPLFFGGFIAKFINKQIAIFIGCIGYEFIMVGFGQIAFVDANFTPDVQAVLNAIILVLFLIYTTNEHEIVEFLMFKKLRAKLAQKKNA